MSGGTRSAVARAAAAAAAATAQAGDDDDCPDDHAQQIAALQQALLLLPGKANAHERNRLNKQLWALQQQQPVQHAHAQLQSTTTLSSQQMSSSLQQQQQQTALATEQLIAHWRVLRPDSVTLPTCARCGDASAAVCVFHPDAKAFAFGTGRFDYGYTSLWDTPHDGWMCCEGAHAATPGCQMEPTHTADPEWWRAYVHLAPPMPCDEDDEDVEEDSDDDPDADAATALDAMDIS